MCECVNIYFFVYKIFARDKIHIHIPNMYTDALYTNSNKKSRQNWTCIHKKAHWKKRWLNYPRFLSNYIFFISFPFWLQKIYICYYRLRTSSYKESWRTIQSTLFCRFFYFRSSSSTRIHYLPISTILLHSWINQVRNMVHFAQTIVKQKINTRKRSTMQLSQNLEIYLKLQFFRSLFLSLILRCSVYTKKKFKCKITNFL